MSGSPLRGVALSETASTALNLAALRCAAGDVVTTGQVFACLAEVDVRGDWSRFWLNVSPVDLVLLNGTPDDGADTPDSDARWRAAPLSPVLTRSLRTLARIADAYELTPVPPAALALALVILPHSGAARRLTEAGGLTHGELVELVQSELLGTQLEGLASLAVDPAPPRSSPVAAAGEDSRGSWLDQVLERSALRMPDDLDLVQVALHRIPAGTIAGLVELRTALREAEGAVRLHGIRPAGEIIGLARRGTAADPGALEILAVAAAEPSPALAEALRIAGVPPAEIALEAELRIGARSAVSKASFTISVVNAVLLVLAADLLVRDAVERRLWWELAFVPLLFAGPPPVSLSLFTPLMALVNPMAAAIHGAECVVSWMRERAERRHLWARTGIRLSLRQNRRRVKRSRRPEWLAGLVTARVVQRAQLAAGRR